MNNRTTQLRIIRGLLWVVRTFGFNLRLDEGMIYEWATNPDGRFDHWFDSPQGRFRIDRALEKFGFQEFIGKILKHSLLLSRKARRLQRNLAHLFGEEYYALRDELAQRAFTQLLANSPEGDPQGLARMAFLHADVQMQTQSGNLKRRAFVNISGSRRSRLSPITEKRQSK